MAPAPAPSYGQASASPLADDQGGPVAGEFDVTIVGAEFSGLPVIGAWRNLLDRLL